MKTLGDVGAGHALGRYELLLPIGSGGMATVWAARLRGTRGFQKLFAVKTMHPSMRNDPQFERMFLDEAQLASQIHHPNVVEILDLGEERGVLYIVMELVDGDPVSVLLKHANEGLGIPLPVGVAIAMQACHGLHAAHELRDELGDLIGLVHRDVSPQNLLLNADGYVKVVDFGVAKINPPEARGGEEGELKGKVAYMSPEQARGEAIDRRTDVFATGILLYQLTTGHHPFRGANETETLTNICSDYPVVSPRVHLPGYPSALESILVRALAKRAENRFSTAHELARALEDALPAIPTGQRQERVSAYLAEALGDRRSKRQEALRLSLRLADHRQRESGDFPDRDSSSVAIAPSSNRWIVKPAEEVEDAASEASETIVEGVARVQEGGPPLSTSTPALGVSSFSDSIPPLQGAGRIPSRWRVPALIVVGIASAFLLLSAAFRSRSADPAATRDPGAEGLHTAGSIGGAPLAAPVSSTPGNEAPSHVAATSPEASLSSDPTPPRPGYPAKARPKFTKLKAKNQRPSPANPPATGFVPPVRDPGF